MSQQLSPPYITENSPYLTTADGQISFDNPEFSQWLEANTSFRFEAGENSYRARKERLSSGVYWYAYKKVAGKLHKRYIGKTEEVTYIRLLEIAQGIRQPSVRQPKPEAAQSPAINPSANAALETLRVEVSELRETVRRHQRALEDLNAGVMPQNTPTTPDYQAIAGTVLNTLGLGKQSQAGKALERFIKELQRVSQD